MRSVAVFLVAAFVACSGPGEKADTVTSGLTGTPKAGAAGTLDGEAKTESSDESDNELLERARQTFMGDLPDLRERRLVRVLISYSKSNFFHDGARPRGFEVELLRAWEKQLNEGAKTYDRVKVVFVPTPFDRLLEDLREGKGDIAAAGLTVTPERESLVAFADPYIPRVNEVLVLNREEENVASLEALGGKRILVRAGSTYVPHLETLNLRLRDGGAKPVEIVEADPRLVTEDLLEMVNAGALKMTVADHHIAEAWAEVLPDIRIRDDLTIHSEGSIAWAVRKNSPRLLESLNTFVRKNKKGSLLGNVLFKRYYSASKWIGNPVSKAERAKLDTHIALFQAQAYQESGLDQSKKSGAGAVGVMQIKPSTAADKWVAVADIHLLENNIHAGTKYLAFLRDRYFDDPAIEPAAQVDFAWAAYNAGPARVRGLRKKAAERGLDPNQWFFNVEKIAAEEVGRETVDYVANINKYYLAYRLQYEATRQREALKSGSRS
jgi:membrane-bound lytic murein transglycosylase MltF